MNFNTIDLLYNKKWHTVAFTDDEWWLVDENNQDEADNLTKQIHEDFYQDIEFCDLLDKAINKQICHSFPILSKPQLKKSKHLSTSAFIYW